MPWIKKCVLLFFFVSLSTSLVLATPDTIWAQDSPTGYWRLVDSYSDQTWVGTNYRGVEAEWNPNFLGNGLSGTYSEYSPKFPDIPNRINLVHTTTCTWELDGAGERLFPGSQLSITLQMTTQVEGSGTEYIADYGYAAWADPGSYNFYSQIGRTEILGEHFTANAFEQTVVTQATYTIPSGTEGEKRSIQLQCDVDNGLGRLWTGQVYVWETQPTQTPAPTVPVTRAPPQPVTGKDGTGGQSPAGEAPPQPSNEPSNAGKEGPSPGTLFGGLAAGAAAAGVAAGAAAAAANAAAGAVEPPPEISNGTPRLDFEEGNTGQIVAETTDRSLKEVVDLAGKAKQSFVDFNHSIYQETGNLGEDLRKDAWGIMRDTVNGTAHDVNTGVKDAAQVGMDLANPQVLRDTLAGTAHDSATLEKMLRQDIQNIFSDPAKRDEFLWNLVGKENFVHSWDPNLPLEKRLMHAGLGVMKLASTLSTGSKAAELGLDRAIANRLASNLASTKASKVAEIAHQVDLAAQAIEHTLGLDPGAGKTILNEGLSLFVGGI